jgi:penicillin-binding protein 2
MPHEDLHSSSDPFRLQTGGRGSLHVDRQQTDLLKHEVMFEDRYTALADRRVFVGEGIPRTRLFFAFGVVGLVMLTLLGRAGWMQFAQGAAFAARADDNRFRHEVLPARRGIIRDRDGAILAENVPSFQVSMRWSDLPHGHDAREQAIATVARTVGMTSGDIMDMLSATGTTADEWVQVARDIPYENAVALSVHLPELSGVSLVTGAKRSYPESGATPSLSHLLGYVGPISPAEYADRRESGYLRNDEIGKTGIERSHEADIRGKAGERLTEVDAFSRPRAAVSDVPPVDGTDVMMTIDLKLQKATEAALRKGMERAKVTRASAILMNAQDGSILAMASLPSFDDNIFAGKVSSTAYKALIEDPDRPLFPSAWAGQFPSGSTIKPLIASAALAEGVVTPRTPVSSVGGIHVGPWFFPDWKPGGHGVVNVRSAIAWSVNTFFYYVGGGYGEFIGLGVDRLTTWMKHFGLGEPTGIDLPGEAAGNVPSQTQKEKTRGERWYIGDTYNLSIGQGDLLVTPLQMARITATVANGGRLVVPHVVKQDVDVDALQKLPLDASVLATVREGMRDTVAYGSGRALSVLPVQSAGKTGTAQWRDDKPYHAWYIGFAPAENPEVVVTVLLESGGEGSSFAVPVAGEMLRAWWYKKQGIEEPPALVVPVIPIPAPVVAVPFVATTTPEIVPSTENPI